MSAPRTIPDAVRGVQTRASDPELSAFVSANAGSGKTHVLVQRVIRLMLDHVKPEKILCITFTKAAAANMAERVFTRLGEWVSLDDDALDAAIRDTGIARTGPQMRARARELFACAIETPGGLKVQTIHALCTRLLQQFPFEANVAARFAVLDERDQTEMMERANLAVLLEAADRPDSETGRALRTAMASAADVTFKDVVREACLSREHFLAWTDRAGGASAAMNEVASVLGVRPDEAIEEIERDIVDGPHMPRSEWSALAGALDGGSENDKKQAARLRDALIQSEGEQVDAYLRVFLNEKMETRKGLLTKKLADALPHLATRFDNETARLAPLIERRRALAIRDRTAALLVIATSVAANYWREKQERGVLDYDDLIDKTLTMLSDGSSSWVHFKLDRGVDHVLIDEAQDTSPRQWEIITRLIEEFTTGEGARDVRRTVFAVGDEKQSIFSFQGAAPREFDRQARELERRFVDARLPFARLAFKHSFRSGYAILQSVDHVFRKEDIYKSIHAPDNGHPLHEALPHAGPSLIDLWKLEIPDARAEIEGWDAPFDQMASTSPEVRLARRVQAEIKSLIENRTMTGGIGCRRPLRYGDVLILVRRRGNAFDTVIQALKKAEVPVAGADRLKLTEHIAVIDLMNLGDALLLPSDDLALAVALKSPLFGLDEDDLYELAYQRKGSLREALSSKASANEKFAAALRRLEACEAHAAHETPFGLYAWLLGSDGGRARILRRLGPEANDAIDEFQQLALNFERKAPASLQGFMAWLRAADTEVKRDMEISRDEVRVMTVHGAKGLEAPVVFLVDTAVSPRDTQRLRLIRIPRGNTAANQGGITVWGNRKAENPPVVAAAREAMLDEVEDEYRRLLYVAMTRAADRLVIAGCMPGNRNKIREESWYDLIEKGLASSKLAMQEISPPGGVVKRYALNDEHVEDEPVSPSVETAPAVPLPDWLHTSPPREEAAPKVIRPSDDIGDDAHRFVPADAGIDRAAALQRGLLVHRLLQSLPDLDRGKRRDAALRYIVRNASSWNDSERETLATQVLALIDDPRFAAVFASGSRAEVPIVGRITQNGMPVVVSGQIDRLVVTPDIILIVDFKTNHAPPRRVADVPKSYIRQLSLYGKLLAKLYPGRSIRAALLWTETPEIMALSPDSLAAV